MARQEREYRRLPGRGRKRGGFFSLTRTRAGLWAGKDHLLCAFSTGYTEEYKRFYYADIQAIVTRKTGRGAAWNFFSALFLFLFSLVALTRTGTEVAVVFWILAGLSLLLLTVNLLRGPTCICHLQTAVSREELPSLSRERTAKKAINLLKPLIEGGQGILTPEEVAAGSAELVRAAESAPSTPARADGLGTARTYTGKIHEALFYLLLLEGISSGAHFLVQSVAMSLLGSLFTIACSILLIVALAKQQGGALTGSLRKITWTAFGYMAVTWFLSYVLGIYLVIKNSGAPGQTQWQTFTMISKMSPTDNPLLMFILGLSIVCGTLLGIAGLVMLREFREEQKARKAAPAVRPLSDSPAASGIEQ